METKHADTIGQAADSTRLAVSVEAIRALPASFAKQHRVLPVKIHDGVIHIASSVPSNARVIDVLHTATMDLKVTKNYGDKIQARSGSR